MADISSWSPVDAGNNAAPPNGWPENMLPNAVNDCARGMMGAIRRNYDQLITGTFAFTNITASGTVTAATVTATDTINGLHLHSSSDITADGDIGCHTLNASATVNAVLIAATNLTASADVSASGYYCDSLLVINTNVISTPGGPATVPALVNEAGNAGILLHHQTQRYHSDAHNFLNAAGSVAAPITASAFTVVSDRRLKEDIEPAPEGLPEVLRLNPVSFKRLHATGREVGFVAQDVADALPQAVSSVDLNGESTLAVNAIPILAALVGAIKDLSKRLDSLEAR